MSHFAGRNEPSTSIQPSGDLVRWIDREVHRGCAEPTTAIEGCSDDLGPEPATLMIGIDGKVHDLGHLLAMSQCENGDSHPGHIDECKRFPSSIIGLNIGLRENYKSNRLVTGNQRQLLSSHPHPKRCAPVRTIDRHEGSGRFGTHAPCLRHQRAEQAHVRPTR